MSIRAFITRHGPLVCYIAVIVTIMLVLRLFYG